MKTAINIQPLLHSGKSGIGYYQSEIVRALLSRSGNDEYILNYFDLSGKKRSTAEKYKSNNAEIQCCNWFNASIYQLIWSIFPLPYSFFFKSGPDVSVFFNYYLPPGVKGKKVLVVYDTVIKDHPETVRFKTKLMLTLTLKASIKRADRIITISEFSKKQIIKHFGVDEDKISVAPCAADLNRYYPMEKADDAVSAVKARYGIGGKYYLYLGNLEPRKNIVRLICAYADARSGKSGLPLLVLAGGKGWLYEEIFEKVKELGLEDSVVFTGYVADEDVPLLINGAEAFCFPSLYEGFGMPPLEAMACGVPVIASNATSLPEVMGDCGILVDPYSVPEISAALTDILDEDFAKKQRAMGIERAGQFSWEKSAEVFHGVFEDLLK